MKETLLYYFTAVVFSSSSVLFGGSSTVHMVHFSYPDLSFFYRLLKQSLKHEQSISTAFNPISEIVLNSPKSTGRKKKKKADRILQVHPPQKLGLAAVCING